MHPDECPWKPTINDRICGDHFVGGWPIADPSHPAYIPTLNLGRAALQRANSEASLARVVRRLAVKQKKQEQCERQEEESRKEKQQGGIR